MDSPISAKVLRGTRLDDIFTNPKPVVGMVHLPALPGSMGYDGNVEQIYSRAISDATALERAGFDGLIVENMWDKPYPVGKVSLEQAVVMAAVVREISRTVSLPVGVNIQFNAVDAEIAVARYCGGSFVRIEALVDRLVTPSGICEPAANLISRLLAQDKARRPAILADVQVKESLMAHSVPFEVSCEWAQSTGLADGLIVTGTATGRSTPVEKIRAARKMGLPVWVGSGVTVSTVASILQEADGVIVGSSIKVDGRVENPVCYERARALIKAVQDLRSAIQSR